MTDPRAISTGIGQGEAQVFTPYQTDYFDKKAQLALKEKDAQAKRYAELGSMPVWSRDLPEFKNKLNNVRDFYTQNARKIMSGDFDTKVKLNELQGDLAQYATSSNASKKFYDTMKKKWDGTKYTQESLNALEGFAATPGQFDTRGYNYIPLFDKQDWLKNLSGQISKLGYDYSKLDLQTLPDGSRVIVNEAKQPVNELTGIINSQLDAARNVYQGQVDETLTFDEAFNYGKGFLGQKRGVTQARDPYVPGGRPEKVKLEIITDTSVQENTPYRLKGTDSGMSMQSGSTTNKEFSIPFKSDKASISFKPSVNAVPVAGTYVRESIQDGKTVREKYEARPGKDFDSEKVRSMIPSGKWRIEDVSIIEAFGPDEVGTETKKKIGGYPVPADYKGTQKKEKRAYATLTDKSGRKVYVPVKEVESVLKDVYTDSWVAKKQELINQIKAKGYTAALKDFADMSVVTEEKPVSSEKPSKGKAY